MSSDLKQHYGSAEGPLGFPMTDRQAFALETILKALPQEEAFRYRKGILGAGLTEISPGERSDVSWISTENPDRLGEVVVARGMNDGQFRLNPIVTLNHAYSLPPVGRSLWRKQTRDGTLRGIKAKTQYPARPADWPAEKDWPADLAFSLVQADLLRGKSIGFLPVKVHPPTAAERKQEGWDGVELVIDEWILLEYACVFLPAQQQAVVESVGKTVPEWACKALGLEAESAPVVPFTPLASVERALETALAKVDPLALVEGLIDAQLDRFRGRV